MSSSRSIETRMFEATSKELFTVHARRYFRQRWWFLLFLIGLAGYVLSKGVHAASLTFVFFLLSFPLIILGYFWLVAHTRTGHAFRVPRRFTFTPDAITCTLETDEQATVPLRELHSVEIYPGYMLLYVRKNRFFYVPDSAFNHDEDREKVLQWIRSAREQGK